jgi:hypothetical protein
MTALNRSDTAWRNWIVVGGLLLAAVLDGRPFEPPKAVARDLDGRYANSSLKGWFEGLRSGKGRCCSDADGKALSDVEWESKNGHYRVRIQGQWLDVPDEAVITEPNRIGWTMVWPDYISPRGGPIRIEIRCFMPGTMI